MVVISASYKTDIPAFYGEWFEHRMGEGYVEIRNPFNGKYSTISLKPDDIDGFVFWTRNISPFLPRLSRLVAGQYPFYVQFTLTGYPRLLESSVPSSDVAIRQFQDFSGAYGQESIVWRYDPILISSVTPVQFHLDNFERLSSALKGATTEVVVSFMHFYQKTNRNLNKLAQKSGLLVENPSPQVQRELLSKLSIVATANGQKLTLCSQPDLESETIQGAACISADRLGLGDGIKVQGNRKGCLCIGARDLGAYDTCPHGCIYCYAVSSPEKAKASLKTHLVARPSL
ncbi:MAG: DUF1848 domain-containing protein [Sneathiella sp.]